MNNGNKLPTLRWLAIRLIVTVTLVDASVTTMAVETSPPNILFILADDVGSEVLQCYGGESYATPRLNQLAREGIRFEHAYTMPVCYPTRTCLLTGQYPFRLDSPEWGAFPEAAASRTLAQLLKRAGYRTAIAGKWQLALLGEDPTHPHRLGFDEYCLFGWHEGPRYYQPHIRQNGKLRQDVRDRYGPDVYCDHLIEFMQQRSKRPCFAFYSMALCHAVTNDLDEPVPVGADGRYQNFSEMVTAMDERVGRMLDALDEGGLTSNTIVVFFSDNGSPHKNIDGARGETLIENLVVSRRHGKDVPGGKAQLSDAGTRVPLIVRWPGQIAADELTDQLVDVSDFLPTLLEIAGAAIPKDITLDGQSFAGLLRGEVGPVRRWVFAEHKDQAFVKDDRWKLYDDGRLFDLASDPDEQRALDHAAVNDEVQTAHSALLQAFASLGLSLTP